MGERAVPGAGWGKQNSVEKGQKAEPCKAGGTVWGWHGVEMKFLCPLFL